MWISELRLLQFKNYENEQFVFHEGTNVLTGLNGMGKTNVFDALHYLAFTKGAFSSVDSLNIQHNRDYFSILGAFEGDGLSEVICYFEKQAGKNVKVDKVDLDRLSEHIGKIPLILSTPYDQALILEGSETRRKFIDGTISQWDQDYLQKLLQYQRLLKQRNAALKKAQNSSRASLNALLDIYDQDICTLSQLIANRRKDLITELVPFFQTSYKQISGSEEVASLIHKTHVLDDEFEKDLLSSREKDIITQRTSMGCHRDDFVFQLNGYPLKKEGSQGQQKSYLLSLKFSQFDLLKSKSKKPNILLDDLFDKLDDSRIDHILEIVNDKKRFGQVFITDARRERIKSLFNSRSGVKFFEISNGKIQE